MITGTMDAAEFFDDVTKKFPRWWRPHEQWRGDVMKSLQRFHPRQIAAAHAIIIRSETRPSLEELEEILSQQSASLFPKETKLPLDDVVGQWMLNNGLADAFARAKHSERHAITKLIDMMRFDDGWSARLAVHAGLQTHWAPWERIENLANAAHKAEINERRITTPGYRPPVGDYKVELPKPPAWMPKDMRDERADRRSAIMARHGGMVAGGSAIISDPDWQAMNEELDAYESQVRLEHYGDMMDG